MKKAFLFIIASSFAVLAFGQQREKLKQSAEVLANALVKEDFITILNGMYPRAIDSLGGRANVEKAMSVGIRMIKERGPSFKSASIGEPGEIKNIGERLFCLLPQTIVLSDKDGSYAATSLMLAISEDRGEHWFFLSTGTMKDNDLYRLFPELKGKMDFPKQGDAIFTPNKY